MLKRKSQVEGSVANSKVAVIHDLDPGSSRLVGGIETWIRDFLSFTSASFLILGSQTTLERDIPVSLDRHRFIPVVRIPSRNPKIPNVLRLIFGVVKKKELLPDRIQVHRLELVPVMKLLRKESFVSLVVHTDLSQQRNFSRDWRWRLYKPFFSLLVQTAIRQADRVLVYSINGFNQVSRMNPQAKLGEAWFNDRIFYLTKPQMKGAKFLWVGRFEKVKDPLMALRAFAASARTHPFSLALVGSGSLLFPIRTEIERLGVQERVQVLGPVSQSDLAKIFNSSDYLLHSSHFEGSPRVILEALACGMGLVSNVASDPEGWVDSSANHVRVTERSVQGFADGLRIASQKEPNRAEISESVRHRAASLVVKETEDFLDGLA